jgi:gas vesicle protein
MEHERASGATAVLAFLGGAALGAIAALLLAPQPGRKTREQLKGYASKAEDTLREAVTEAGQRFEEAVHEGKEYVEARKSVLREAFEAGRDAMKKEREKMESNH